MTDLPNRPKPRFPESKVDAVRDLMSHQLAAWNVGLGDLSICGGARGSDILFAEICLERGAEVWLCLSLKEELFIKESIRVEGTGWEARFNALKTHEGIRILFQGRDSPLPDDLSPFAAANIWMVEVAKKEASSADRLYALLVWDELSTGDGPGGTSDFAARVREAGGHLAVINPVRLLGA
ncbi:MAG: hypothetical protein JST68_21490 [Bacteroidetes bacterium]|nr:hypothetical protein [Bacteroidota bacterium]